MNDERYRELLERLGGIAQHLGTRSFLVGGPVRDLILGRPSPDLDIAVEVGTREFGAAVAKEFGGRFVYHSRFLTGTVSFPQPQSTSSRQQARESGRNSLLPSHIDITQTRAETYERPAVLPAVRPASIIGDLGRRDFTINAMAMEITPGSFGTFIDPFDGRADVEQGRVRVLHARSFIDDPTRIFRCIRFAARLRFAIEPQTLDLMRSAVKERLPAFLTPERVLYELRLICAEQQALPIVKALVRERVLEAAWRWTPPAGFVAGLAKLACRELRMPNFDLRSSFLVPRSSFIVPRSSFIVHRSSFLGQSPFLGNSECRTSKFEPRTSDFQRSCPAPELLFIYWLSVLPLTDRFPIRKEERDAATAVAGFVKLEHKLKRKLKPSAVYKLLRPVPEPALHVLAVLEAKDVSVHIKAFLDNYRKVRIATTGADLRGAGLEPGPAYRKILDELLFARLDGRIRTVTEERQMLAKLMEKLRAQR
jgi:tRNA nucleotidyltransferase (CCA-adding enzyme)